MTVETARRDLPAGAAGPTSAPEPWHRRRIRRRQGTWSGRPGHRTRPRGSHGRGLALFVVSLRGIDLAGMNGLGLLSVLPVGAIAGVMVIALAFVVGLVLRRPLTAGLAALARRTGRLSGRDHDLRRARTAVSDHLPDRRLRPLHQPDRTHGARAGRLLQLARVLRADRLRDRRRRDPQPPGVDEDLAGRHRPGLPAGALPPHAPFTSPGGPSGWRPSSSASATGSGRTTSRRSRSTTCSTSSSWPSWSTGSPVRSPDSPGSAPGRRRLPWPSATARAAPARGAVRPAGHDGPAMVPLRPPGRPSSRSRP